MAGRLCTESIEFGAKYIGSGGKRLVPDYVTKQYGLVASAMTTVIEYA